MRRIRGRASRLPGHDHPGRGGERSSRSSRSGKGSGIRCFTPASPGTRSPLKTCSSSEVERLLRRIRRSVCKGIGFSGPSPGDRRRHRRDDPGRPSGSSGISRSTGRGKGPTTPHRWNPTGCAGWSSDIHNVAKALQRKKTDLLPVEIPQREKLKQFRLLLWLRSSTKLLRISHEALELCPELTCFPFCHHVIVLTGGGRLSLFSGRPARSSHTVRIVRLRPVSSGFCAGPVDVPRSSCPVQTAPVD